MKTYAGKHHRELVSLFFLPDMLNRDPMMHGQTNTTHQLVSASRSHDLIALLYSRVSSRDLALQQVVVYRCNYYRSCRSIQTKMLSHC